MSYRAPRTKLSTHEVTNQSPWLEDVNLYSSDPILRSSCAWSGASVYHKRLEEFGARVGASETQTWCIQANKAPPIFTPYDRNGRRIDEVEFHPAYHQLMALGLEAGVSGAAWNVPQAGHALHAALLFLMGQADYGVCCPMSMTYAAVAAMRASAPAAAEWIPRMIAEAYDFRSIPAAEKRAVTVGMAMTEKQGGSDVRANGSRAVRQAGDEYLLAGHKWFCSAPMSDAFLTLAYSDGGLTCFLAPRWRPGGERNAIEIQRLKDKLGDRSNASAEIEYRDAWSLRIGEEGKGLRTILDMVNLTRFDCIVGSATQMRQAGALAMWHVQGRTAFQRKLVDQPLMRAVLADLCLDVEASMALAFRLGAALDASTDPREAALARIGLPLAKYFVTKRAPAIVAEAMECLGGAGYVEDWPMARLFRQSPLNAIWEGSGNVIALDVVRALQRDPQTREALMNELKDCAGADRRFLLAQETADRLLAASLPEADARHLVEHLALVWAGAILTKNAPTPVVDGFLARRIAERSLTLGAGRTVIDDTALLSRLALEV